MILFEAGSIYSVEHGDVQLRAGDITPLRTQPLQTIADLEGPLMVRGVQPPDFAIFASLADHEGVATVPYLVSHYGPQRSQIVPYTVVDADPQHYGSFELARKLQSIDTDSLESFGLTALVRALDRRYPFPHR